MNNEIFNVPVITGKSNSTITRIGKLQNKKYRNDEKLFICDGAKLFLEAYKFNAEIKYIIIDNEALIDNEIINKVKDLQKKGVNVLCVDGSNFKKLTTESAPQGIITVCEYFSKKHSFENTCEDFGPEDKIVMIESVRDPGNMGTILRNAVAFGIDKLVLSSDCVDIYSPKVVRSSMGAIFKINITVTDNFCDVISDFKKQGRRVIGAALGKDSMVLGKDKISSSDIFILGNEGHGLSNDVLKECSETIFIPIKENTESLNVSIASAILMWEISK